jgi:hypothetical protein
MTFPTSKSCKRCGETKALTEYTHRTASPDGLAAWCRECHLACYRKRAAHRRAHRDSITTPATKTCSRCRVTLDSREFHRSTATYDGLQTFCKVCSVQASREYRATSGKPRARTRTGSTTA